MSCRNRLVCIHRILGELPAGPHVEAVPVPAAGAVASGLIEGWRGPVFVALEAGAGGIDPPLSSARSLVAELARARARHHRQHRARFPAHQQVLQPFLQWTRSLKRRTMLKTLRQIASIGIVSEPPPAADECLRLREALQTRDSCRARARAVHSPRRRRFLQRLRARDPCLNNPLYNLEGLGIRFVASPRHADLLLVTGPVSRHMEVALRRTYEATPDPKLVVALGDCGCTGGIFGESYASRGRVSNVIPVDVAVPGCPPSPTRILQGILAALARSEGEKTPSSAASDADDTTPLPR